MQPTIIGQIVATALVATIGDKRLSPQRATWRLGSDWCRGKIRAVARSAWAASPNLGMAIYAACWCTVSAGECRNRGAGLVRHRAALLSLTGRDGEAGPGRGARSRPFGARSGGLVPRGDDRG